MVLVGLSVLVTIVILNIHYRKPSTHKMLCIFAFFDEFELSWGCIMCILFSFTFINAILKSINIFFYFFLFIRIFLYEIR